MPECTWTNREDKILMLNRHSEAKYLKILLPNKTITQIYTRKHKLKKERGEVLKKVDIPEPKKCTLGMEEGKTYILNGNDGRSTKKEIRARVIKVYPAFVLCELKHGIKECFLRVDLGRTIRYKEVG